MTARPLTDKQQYVYHNIRLYQLTHRVSPTVRELAKMCGFASSNNASKYVKRLQKAGAIELGKYGQILFPPCVCCPLPPLPSEL